MSADLSADRHDILSFIDFLRTRARYGGVAKCLEATTFIRP